MGFFSSLGSFVSSAVSSVASAASSAWSAAKEWAGAAMGWMAEKAEGFVDGVKKAWQVVKPHIDKIRMGLRAAAEAVPIPWLKTALSMLDKGIGALTAFENSPIAKKVDAAIKWSIEMAKRWQAGRKQTEAQAEAQEIDDLLDETELAQAKRHQETFRFAEREVVPEEQRHQMELAAAINDFEVAKADMAKAIAAGPADFEHYLRLRATQKLMKMADKAFRAAQSVDDLSADDLFLVRIASDLIKDKPELSREAAARLDRLLTERYNKKLQPFVFEELVASWAKRAEALGNQWSLDNLVHAKDTMLLKNLTIARDIQGELSPEEAAMLAELEQRVPQEKGKLDALAQNQRDIQRYVGAAEGFLQLLEKTPEQLEAEDRDFLQEDGPAVGKLLIECADKEIAFNQLSDEEKALINDFANAFRKDSQQRMKEILEVAA
ncbi:hypothetical protein [Massilia arenae]|uniref:DUF349 domain-containing protein n=1 Tax=Massilia arenae TaxID=2603288 RepID=A0A5C7FUY0_9BURK|nr:hypothetical protein [Massilia arenae]TXG00187.1 hypothetical protein FVD38_09195 [Massilia arenae]